jgi:hypothetical protein
MGMRRMMWSVCGLVASGLLMAATAAAQTAGSQAPASGPSPAAPAAAAPAATPGDLEVVASYTGKGEVRADREISVFLFDTPIINESSMPIGVDVIEKNGGSVKFSGLPGPLVYVVLVYDENGSYDRQGPPAPGTPIFIHMKDGAPEGVKPGKDAKVTLTFDDTRRM